MSTVMPPLSLRQRVFKAGSWTLLGYGGGLVLRFVSNLVLTRLLFPEAFGLMALMYAILTGINMLTDLGLNQSIVRSVRGAEPAYANTAWTLQVAKGVLVALAMVATADVAAAHFEQPEMSQLMWGIALVALVTSFGSTGVAIATRNVELARLTQIDLVTQAIGIVATVLFAWWRPNVWALIWGNLVTSVLRVAASHLLLPGPKNRFAWDRSAARGIFSFGGWMMLSSTITFLLGEGSRLLSASLLDIRLIGLIGLAAALSLMTGNAIQQLAGRVLFPAYAEVARSNDRERLSRVVEKSRFTQILPSWGVSVLLCFAGGWLIDFLYDPRYADAGLVLRIQAAGLMVGILTSSYGGVLWSIGKMRMSTLLLAIQAVFLWCGMLAGFHLGGPIGVLVGSAATGWLMYPVTAVVFAREGLWHPRLDLPILAASIAVTALMVLTTDWSPAQAWHAK
jgi:O-antigen/teichoic acid export membrane protein